MSTQLILYPQNYNGQYNSITNPTAAYTNFISNGQLFTGLGSTTLYNTNSVKPTLAAILNEHPTIVNTWYRFTTIVGAPGNWGAVTAPAVALNSLVLSVNDIAEGHTGVYQQLTGLTVGATYVVKITITTGQPGAINLATYLPNTGVEQASYQFSSNTTSISWNFHATSTNQILSVDYIGGTANLLIESIAVLSITTTPSGVFTDLNDGQVICDLYQEEDIPLTLSIDDFKNVAEKVQSYSKDFNLPATKRNNRIFNNMFEVTRADDGLIFNPYVRTKCVLKQDGFILFEGYLRLIDVKDKEGEISYNVNLYSEVIALADVLKEATFSDLDFTELEHEYNKQEIKRSWNESPDASITYTNPSTSGFRETYDTLRYPFIDWTHQYIIAAAGGSPTEGNPQLPSLETVFRPCIQLKYLIERIFAASGFNFTSNFFETTDFKKLYMDFNWGSNDFGTEVTSGSYSGQTTAPIIGFISNATYQNYQLQTVFVVQPLPNFSPDLNYDYTNNRFVALNNNTQYNIEYTMLYEGIYNDGLNFRWAHLDSGGTLIAAIDADNQSYNPLFQGSFSVVLQAGETLQAQALSTTYHDYRQRIYYNSTTGVILASTGGSLVTTHTILQTLRGELGQWDFLKGIMTMFNLVSMVDENDPDNILIEPYSDVFINNTNSKRLDWTERVDVSEMELKPLTDLNKNTIFQFVEDEDDYVFRQYKISTSGHLYGSKEIDASGFTILEGTKEIVAEPFGATVSKPLDAQFSHFITPAIYSMTDEGTSEGFDNSPRIFYNNGIKDTGASYFIPEQNGLTGENQDDFLQFSHLSSLPPGAISITRRDFVFESQQLFSGLGNSPTDNLYNTYWAPYFNELYNADTRTMSLKVNLSPSDVAAFKFYDTVFIKNRTFRVNKIEYKPNDLATVEFILIP